jgi:hypothetical protein
VDYSPSQKAVLYAAALARGDYAEADKIMSEMSIQELAEMGEHLDGLIAIQERKP